MRLLKLLLILFVCAAGPAVAGPFEDGVAAHDKGDYAAALRLWRPIAEQGDASAQYNLGQMYRNGQGVPQDYIQAHMWFNLATAQNDANAAKNRDIVAAKMAPAQIAEAQKMAREREHADDGVAGVSKLDSLAGWIFEQGQRLAD